MNSERGVKYILICTLKTHFKYEHAGVPSSLVLRTQHCHCFSWGSIPSQGTKALQAVACQTKAPHQYMISSRDAKKKKKKMIWPNPIPIHDQISLSYLKIEKFFNFTIKIKPYRYHHTFLDKN